MADEIIAKDEGGAYQLPPEGQFLAVCCDVIDLGMVENKTYNKMQHKCAIVFQLDEENDKGARFEVAERFSVSMNEKANLRQFLGNWRGKTYSDAEAKEGAPLHKLEGVGALVQIQYNIGANGKTYANIGTIMKAPKGTAIKIEGYKRWEGWKKSVAPMHDDAPPPDDGGQFEDDDDLPFNHGRTERPRQISGHDGELALGMASREMNALNEGR